MDLLNQLREVMEARDEEILMLRDHLALMKIENQDLNEEVARLNGIIGELKDQIHEQRRESDKHETPTTKSDVDDIGNFEEQDEPEEDVRKNVQLGADRSPSTLTENADRRGERADSNITAQATTRGQHDRNAKVGSEDAVCGDGEEIRACKNAAAAPCCQDRFHELNENATVGQKEAVVGNNAGADTIGDEGVASTNGSSSVMDESKVGNEGGVVAAEDVEDGVVDVEIIEKDSPSPSTIDEQEIVVDFSLTDKENQSSKNSTNCYIRSVEQGLSPNENLPPQVPEHQHLLANPQRSYPFLYTPLTASAAMGFNCRHETSTPDSDADGKLREMKEKRLSKAARRRNKNVSTSFVTLAKDDADYDMDSVLRNLGEDGDSKARKKGSNKKNRL